MYSRTCMFLSPTKQNIDFGPVFDIEGWNQLFIEVICNFQPLLVFEAAKTCGQN